MIQIQIIFTKSVPIENQAKSIQIEKNDIISIVKSTNDFLLIKI